jgi:hypothetical protein
MSNAGKGGRRGTNGVQFLPGGKARPTSTVSTQAVPDHTDAERSPVDFLPMAEARGFLRRASHMVESRLAGSCFTGDRSLGRSQGLSDIPSTGV